jgi:hypothetical protein
MIICFNGHSERLRWRRTGRGRSRNVHLQPGRPPIGRPIRLRRRPVGVAAGSWPADRYIGEFGLARHSAAAAGRPRTRATRTDKPNKWLPCYTANKSRLILAIIVRAAAKAASRLLRRRVFALRKRERERAAAFLSYQEARNFRRLMARNLRADGFDNKRRLTSAGRRGSPVGM